MNDVDITTAMKLCYDAAAAVAQAAEEEPPTTSDEWEDWDKPQQIASPELIAAFERRTTRRKRG